MQRTGRGGNQAATHSALARAIVQYLGWAGAWVFRVHGGLGQRAGCPDILACLSGRLVGVEVKTGAAVLSPTQQAERSEIERAGGLFVEARSLEDVEQALVGAGLCRPMLAR